MTSEELEARLAILKRLAEIDCTDIDSGHTVPLMRLKAPEFFEVFVAMSNPIWPAQFAAAMSEALPLLAGVWGVSPQLNVEDCCELLGWQRPSAQVAIRDDNGNARPETPTNVVQFRGNPFG